MNLGMPARRAAGLFLFVCLSGAPLQARAQAPGQLVTSAVIPTGASPIVRVQMRSGTLILHVANRNEVRISSSAPVSVRSFPPQIVAGALRPSIPIFATTVLTKNGPLTLPPEEFTLDVSSGPHDAVFLQGMDAAIDMTIPANTALILANVGRGRIDVRGYHGGTFVLRVRGGGIRLRNVTGTGYVETLRGQIFAAASRFVRLRARTAIGNLIFERCNARQIDVSSINGSIVYDDGNFEPGVARFASLNGDVALGLGQGKVRIAAHSSVGQIVSALSTTRASKSDALVQTDSAGTAVTASSERGTIYLYSGAFDRRHAAGAQWTPLARLLPRRISPLPQRAPARRPATVRHTPR